MPEITSRLSTALALALVTSLLANTATAQDDTDGWRTIEFETTEVTAPDVAITPDDGSPTPRVRWVRMSTGTIPGQ